MSLGPRCLLVPGALTAPSLAQRLSSHPPFTPGQNLLGSTGPAKARTRTRGFWKSSPGSEARANTHGLECQRPTSKGQQQLTCRWVGGPLPQLSPPRSVSLPAACPSLHRPCSCYYKLQPPLSGDVGAEGTNRAWKSQACTSSHQMSAPPRRPSVLICGLSAPVPRGPAERGRSTMTVDADRVPPCSVFGINSSPYVKPVAKCPALSPIRRAANGLLLPAPPVASGKFSVRVGVCRVTGGPSRTVFLSRTKWDGTALGLRKGGDSDPRSAVDAPGGHSARRSKPDTRRQRRGDPMGGVRRGGEVTEAAEGWTPGLGDGEWGVRVSWGPFRFGRVRTFWRQILAMTA